MKIFYGWWVVLAGLSCNIVGIGIGSSSFSVLLKYLSEDMGWSRASISGAKSIYFFIATLVSPVVGRGLDLYDPRRIILPCLTLMLGSYMLLSQMTSVWQLYILYALAGAGYAALAPIIISSVIIRWFKKKRGLATAIATTGPSLGGMIIVPLANFLFLSMGWRYGVLTLGTLSWVLAFTIVATFMRARPEGIGLSPDGVKEVNNPEKNPQLGVIAHHGAVALPLEEGISAGKALATAQFWLLNVCFLLTHMSVTAMALHHFSFYVDIGFSKVGASFIASAFFAASLLGHLGIGKLCDIFNKKLLAIISYLFMAAGLLSLLLVEVPALKTPIVIIFLLTFGVFHSGKTVPEFVLVAELFGTASIGSLLGVCRFIKGMGGSLGPFLAGLIFDMYGNYNVAFIIFAIACILSAIVIGFVKPLVISH